ncbi:MAG TPA: DUF3592 domain-containing protein [Candidatus Sulfotelmatobacter sp.]|jgi:hypothetical protein|nr:DUF3592 domain-containing protein [Candidatus Sulfotelmatobacter sp.]
MNIILKSIAAWRILAPTGIAIGILWLVISSIMSLVYVCTDGVVIRSIQNGSGDNAVFCPVFVFQDKSGTQHTNQSTGGSNPPRFPVGSKVMILYPAKNPDAGLIEDRLLMWIVPSILIGLGIFYGFVGLAVKQWLEKKQLPAR